MTDRAPFERSDFATFATDQPFEVAVAIGFFDHIDDLAAVLARVRTVTSGRLLASFPAETFPRSLLRRRRYAKRGVRLRFYRAEEIITLSLAAGFDAARVLPLSADYFLVADVTAAP